MINNIYANSVFLDETVLKAYMDPDHQYYAKARSFFLDLDDMERDFVSTSYVIFDTHEWLRDNYGYAHAEFFLSTIEEAMKAGKLSLISGNEQLEQEAKSLLLHYPQLEFSLGEAVTAVVVLTYDILRIFSFNRTYKALNQLRADVRIIPSIG